MGKYSFIADAIEKISQIGSIGRNIKRLRPEFRAAEGIKNLFNEVEGVKRLGLKIDRFENNVEDAVLVLKNGEKRSVNIRNLLSTIRSGDARALKGILKTADDTAFDSKVLDAFASESKKVVGSAHYVADEVDDTLKHVSLGLNKTENEELLRTLTQHSDVDARTLIGTKVDAKALERIEQIEKSLKIHESHFNVQPNSLARFGLKVGVVVGVVSIPFGFFVKRVMDAHTGCMKYTTQSNGQVKICRLQKYTLGFSDVVDPNITGPIPNCQNVPVPSFGYNVERHTIDTPMPGHPHCSILCSDVYLMGSSNAEIESAYDNHVVKDIIRAVNFNPNVTYRCTSPTVSQTLGNMITSTADTIEGVGKAIFTDAALFLKIGLGIGSFVGVILLVNTLRKSFKNKNTDEPLPNT